MQAGTTEKRPPRTKGTGRTRAGKVRLNTLSDLDARTAAYRRFQDLVTSYSADCGGDLSTAKQAIIQRIVSLQVWLEDAEAKYALTGDLDISVYTTAANAFRRLLEPIGLERKAKDITPTLDDYVRSTAEKSA